MSASVAGPPPYGPAILPTGISTSTPATGRDQQRGQWTRRARGLRLSGAAGGDVGGCLSVAARQPGRALPTVLVASAALVDIDARVLVQQRPEGKSWAGWWEFPGGKIHSGETPEAAVVRELAEELGLDITESCLAPFTFTSFAYDDFHLLMMLYLCRVWRGAPVGREGQTLKWIRPLDLTRLPRLLPADVPLVAMLRDWL
ncbi:MAG: (deoxy)nucleoside triphosphate pyrophosphohydrolase [Rhodospirillales bacterium]|nr:(deoxy)nucleoside triphosphate pyrophosphohydrolase [Rhodospirillales bacterium]